MMIHRFTVPLMLAAAPITVAADASDEQRQVLLGELHGMTGEAERMLIRYQWIPLSQSLVAPLTIDEIEEQLASLDDASENTIDRFHLSLYAEDLRQRVRDIGGRFVGGEIDLHLDANTYRRTDFTPDRKTVASVTAADKKNRVQWTSGSGQCDLTRAAGTITERLSFYPPLDHRFSAALKQHVRVPDDSDSAELIYESADAANLTGTLRFRWPSCELVQRTVKRQTTGTTDRYYYCRFVETPQGHSVPILTYHFRCDHQRNITSAEIRMVQAYLFGNDCPAIDLRVPVPAGTTIVDMRNPRRRRVIRSQGEVGGVVELMDIRSD